MRIQERARHCKACGDTTAHHRHLAPIRFALAAGFAALAAYGHSRGSGPWLTGIATALAAVPLLHSCRHHWRLHCMRCEGRWRATERAQGPTLDRRTVFGRL